MNPLPVTTKILRCLCVIAIIPSSIIIWSNSGEGFYEQEQFSNTDERRLLDYYWKSSREFYSQGLFNSALFQAKKMMEIDPNNRDARDLINAIKSKQASAGQSQYQGSNRVSSVSQSSAQQYPRQSVSAIQAFSNQSAVANESVTSLLSKANAAIMLQNFPQAVTYLETILVWDPANAQAQSMLLEIEKKQRIEYEKKYRRIRKEKANEFRERIRKEELQGQTPSSGDVMDESTYLKKRIERERVQNIQQRENLVEQRIRESLYKKVEAEERNRLDTILRGVEESKFYQMFEKWEDEKKQAEYLQRRRINTFILRAETMMEARRYEEAMVYLNNVFMIDPYNARAQKMRQKVERNLTKKKRQSSREEDKLFEEEKKAYEQIRKKVRDKKVNELMRDAQRYYDIGEFIKAREYAQKVLVLNPGYREGERLLEKIDEKITEIEKIRSTFSPADEEAKKRAMQEAFLEAARVLELEIIKEKQEEQQVQERVSFILSRVDDFVSKADFDAALIELNRAFIVDPQSQFVVNKIQEIKKQKQEFEKRGYARTPAVQEREQKVNSEDSTILSITAKEERSDMVDTAEKKKKREQIYRQSKKIASASARKVYKERVKEYINKAQAYLEENKFDEAKKEIEKIFLFDNNNPTAKDLIARIVEFEVAFDKGKVEAQDDALQQGLKLQQLRESFQDTSGEADIVRLTEEAKIEDVATKEVTIESLINEGKRLFKKKMYYEAINKLEAIFVLDAANEEASELIDKVKGEMLEEREKERKKIQEEQQKEIRNKISGYVAEIRDLHLQGEYTNAAIIIEKGLLLDPGNRYLLELKKINERGTREEIKKEITPSEEISNLINLGIKEYIQGNYFEAKNYFKKVLDIDPNDQKAINSIQKIDQKIESLNASEQ